MILLQCMGINRSILIIVNEEVCYSFRTLQIVTLYVITICERMLEEFACHIM